MKIMLVGALGSIGRRYAHILHRIKGIDLVALDPAFDAKHRNADWFTERNIPTLSPNKGQDYVWPKRDEYKPDKVLIASPTNTHDEWCRKCIEHKTAFMCEKPLTKDLDSCVSLAIAADSTGTPAHVVCNYKFALQGTTRSYYDPISYNYYSTGNDGALWDCAQLLYFNPDMKIQTDSPIWTLEVEHRRRTQNLPYRKLEMGYIEMIEDWLGGGESCWTLEDGVKMTRTVLQRIKKEEKKNGKASKRGW